MTAVWKYAPKPIFHLYLPTENNAVHNFPWKNITTWLFGMNCKLLSWTLMEMTQIPSQQFIRLLVTRRVVVDNLDRWLDIIKAPSNPFLKDTWYLDKQAWLFSCPILSTRLTSQINSLVMRTRDTQSERLERSGHGAQEHAQMIRDGQTRKVDAS